MLRRSRHSVGRTSALHRRIPSDRHRCDPAENHGIRVAQLTAYTGKVTDGIGKLGIIAWGVRLFSETIWGDIALVDLLCDGCGSLYSVLPLGIPFLNFGVGW